MKTSQKIDIKILLNIDATNFIKYAPFRDEYKFAFYYDDPDNVWPTHLAFESESDLTWFLLKNPI